MPLPPFCSLFMLTSQMGLPKHQTSLRNAFPHPKNNKTKANKWNLSGPWPPTEPWKQTVPKEELHEYVWLAERRGTSINCTTTPPSLPPSLSCMQVGLNIVIPHRRAVGTGFANMSRVREGIKKTNVWKEEGISPKPVKLQKDKFFMMQRHSHMRVLLPVLSRIKAKRGEESVLDSQKSSQGWGWSGCEVIRLGARVAKIKQVCSVTTRGGEKERGRKSREREREGGRGPTAPRAQTIGGGRASFFCCENRGSGKKRRGSGNEGAGWKEGGGGSQFWESPLLWHLVMKGPVEKAHDLFLPLFLSASNILSEMIQPCSIRAWITWKLTLK